MEILSKLFGSEAKIKIMRLFLFNPDTIFDLDLISQKAKVAPKIARKEVTLLENAKLINSKSFQKTESKKVRGKIRDVKVKNKGYILNEKFYYLNGLRQLLITSKTLESDEIIKKLSKAGKLKFVALAGVFIQNPESRLDILVVGNNMNQSAVSRVIKEFESQIGKELMFSYFEMKDFQYRMGMYDKLLRDVFDYPHEVIFDKLSD